MAQEAEDLRLDHVEAHAVDRAEVAKGLAEVPDPDDGGLAAAAAEMAMAGKIGVFLDEQAAGAIPLHAWLFGEDQARYLLATALPEAILDAASDASIPAAAIGNCCGDSFSVAGFSRPISEIRAAHEGWMPNFMSTV